jgi:large-conductance mechanosensitive channel
MLRKVVLTGLLLFTSERPMVRAVCATLVCCIMNINLNYFQPHKNLIVFWVEQLANLSSTIKYLFAVVIAAGGAMDAADASNNVDPEDARLMGYLLIISDLACYIISAFAIITCVALLRRSILHAKKMEKDEKVESNASIARKTTGENSSVQDALQRKLNRASITPQVHRRASLRAEIPSDVGLSAMLAHANDHKKTPKKSDVSLKALVTRASEEKKVQNTEVEHDRSLNRVQKEINERSRDSHSRLQKRLTKRKTYTSKVVVAPELKLDNL